MPGFSKGDIIAISTPFVFALLFEERQNHCEQCFGLLDPKQKIVCADCGYVYYCGEKCRDDSIATGFHTVECHITRHRRPLRNLSRLIARVLVRLYPSAGGNKLESSTSTAAEWIRGHKRDWNCLMDHYSDVTHDPSAMHTFSYIYEELEFIFDGNVHPALETFIDVETLIRIYGKILVNSFAVQESGPLKRGGRSLRQIGRAVYLGPSIFDHSCSPDVLFTFTGTRLHLIALHNTSTTDLRRIYISYIDEFDTIQERRRQLKAAFYFDCECERCQMDSQGFSQLSVIESPGLRLLNDQIEDLYVLTKLEFRYAKLAQSVLHLLPTLSKLPPSQFSQLGTLFPPPDSLELQLRMSLVEAIEQRNISQELERLESVQMIRIFDFLACHQADASALERLAVIYTRFYGDRSPRLLAKLYHFIGVLLEKVTSISQSRRAGEKAQLEGSLQVISRLFRQAKTIQSFFDDRLVETEPTVVPAEEPEPRKQNSYATRTASYRDLLQNSTESLITSSLNGDGGENAAGNDTRKR